MNRSQKTRTAAAAVYAGAIMFVFGAPLTQLFNYAMHNDVNSYVVLVPLICAYILWIGRRNLGNPSRPAYRTGLGLALAATFVWAMAMAFRPSPWMPERSDQLTLFTLSLVLFIWAGGSLFLGREWMRLAVFPMFFLIFMVPLPSVLVDALESASKVASAEAANIFFSITGTPTLRDGNVFMLPGITIEVAQECSGIRSSYVLILTSLVAGNLFLTRIWSRILLVCFVIPLGIIRNGFRVWSIATLCIHMGPQMIHSVIHRRGGPVFFTLALIPLLLFIWWLRSLERKRSLTVRSQPINSPSMPVLQPIAAPRIGDDSRNVRPS